MKRCSGIYKISNIITNKIYVGSAISLYNREIQHFFHLKQQTHHNKHLQASFNKYGIENFKFEVIEEIVNKNQLISREQFYIDTLNPQYNKCRIAGSPLGIKHSKKFRDACSLRMKNNVPWNKGKSGYLTEEVKLKGKIKSKATKIKNGTYKKIRIESQIPIVQLSLEGAFISYFVSIQAAIRETGAPSIINVLSGKLKTSNRYQWMTKEDYDNGKICINLCLIKKNKIERQNRRKPVIQLDLKDNFIAEYTSCSEVKNKLKINGIHEVLSFRNKTAGGFKWMYKSDYEFLKQVA